MNTDFTSNPRDYLAELERASSPIRELMVDAGRYINYLRSVVRDMLPHFPKDHPHYPGFSEAAAGGPQPAQESLRFTWIWDDSRRNYRLTTVDMGDGLVAGYDHEAGWYERQLIEEIERLRGERRPDETTAQQCVPPCPAHLCAELSKAGMCSAQKAGEKS